MGDFIGPLIVAALIVAGAVAGVKALSTKGRRDGKESEDKKE